MIIVTGAAGFIGSCLVSDLNKAGYEEIILVDDFSNEKKNKNLIGKAFLQKVDRNEFFAWLEKNTIQIDHIFHIGARTDTAEFDKTIFDKLNLNYSKDLWNYCCKNSISLTYASSAATYGMGELGYKDDHNIIPDLKPLNPYGESKNEFDKWVLKQENQPPFWAGYKFFNVYGPNEYHKGRMASVILHAYKQILETHKMKLFRSHHPDFKDGEQLRDFVYVKDLTHVLIYHMENQKMSGIYNLGTGRAQTFMDLVKATFEALEIPADISFIDTPEDIRDKYQYYTQADIDKLRNSGYTEKFHSLEEGAIDYVKNYLMKDSYY